MIKQSVVINGGRVIIIEAIFLFCAETGMVGVVGILVENGNFGKSGTDGFHEAGFPGSCPASNTDHRGRRWFLAAHGGLRVSVSRRTLKTFGCSYLETLGMQQFLCALRGSNDGLNEGDSQAALFEFTEDGRLAGR